MNYEKFVNKTIQFISTGAKVETSQINSDTNLVGSGIVDSLLLTELILYVEDELECTIEVDDFRLATFETIDSIYSSYGQ